MDHPPNVAAADTAEPAPTLAAERQRRRRERFRAGLFIARIEIHETVIGNLIGAGLLAPDDATDMRAVDQALAMIVAQWAAEQSFCVTRDSEPRARRLHSRERSE